jgi:glycosyltransferase involved in cell wall biosynthesis
MEWKMDLIYLYPRLNDSPANVGKSILDNLAKNIDRLPFEDIKLFKMRGDIQIKNDDLKKFEILTLTDINRYKKDYLVHFPISPNLFPNKKLILNLLCILKNKPLIVNLHDEPRRSFYVNAKYEKKIELLSIPTVIFMPSLLKNATKIVTNSHSIDSIVKNSYGIKNTVVIPNGLDDYWFRPPNDCDCHKIDENKYNIFFHGRVTAEKGIDLLVKAVCIYIKTDPDTMLYIAGDGSQKKYLEKLCIKWNIINNVVFLGSVDKETIKYFLGKVDIAIYPSRFDNFPLAIMEALACANCPVYFSEGTGISDFVNKDGYELNQFKPSVENIVQILKSTLNNKNIVNSQKNFSKGYTG